MRACFPMVISDADADPSGHDDCLFWPLTRLPHNFCQANMHPLFRSTPPHKRQNDRETNRKTYNKINKTTERTCATTSLDRSYQVTYYQSMLRPQVHRC